jgi:hypothetical protein
MTALGRRANGVAWQRDGFRLAVLSRASDKVKLAGLHKVTPPIPYKVDRRKQGSAHH